MVTTHKHTATLLSKCSRGSLVPMRDRVCESGINGFFSQLLLSVSGSGVGSGSLRIMIRQRSFMHMPPCSLVNLGPWKTGGSVPAGRAPCPTDHSPRPHSQSPCPNGGISEKIPRPHLNGPARGDVPTSRLVPSVGLQRRGGDSQRLVVDSIV